MFFFVIGRTEDRGAEEGDVDSDQCQLICLCAVVPLARTLFPTFTGSLQGFTCPGPSGCTSLRAGQAPPLCLYCLAEDLFNQVQYRFLSSNYTLADEVGGTPLPQVHGSDFSTT